ncbi:hypothetical protein SLEP1_g52303 [Rubroshorea leprosula]|uniref:Uncharacterized protein n=1 Tax=Rubroshorea leprosula TaxID=152421 RepID=A0AAV5M9L1_9ROSI|nr:hypothetical protein SLEP1_g52303 [Rubroshorea leprosula]
MLGPTFQDRNNLLVSPGNDSAFDGRAEEVIIEDSEDDSEEDLEADSD